MEEYSEEYPEESTNRSFIIASIALGGVFVAGLLALGLYLFKVKPARLSANATQVHEINANNTQVALYAEATSGAQMILAEAAHVVAATVTSAPTEVPTSIPTEEPTQAATNTPETVIVVAPAAIDPNNSSGISGSAGEESVEAMPLVEITQAALPDTGFMDEIGIPVLLFTALALIVVIIISRSIRQVTNQ